MSAFIEVNLLSVQNRNGLFLSSFHDFISNAHCLIRFFVNSFRELLRNACGRMLILVFLLECLLAVLADKRFFINQNIILRMDSFHVTHNALDRSLKVTLRTLSNVIFVLFVLVGVIIDTFNQESHVINSQIILFKLTHLYFSLFLYFIYLSSSSFLDYFCLLFIFL